MKRPSDKNIYSRLRHQDKEAFAEAYDLYLDHIYRFVYFKVGNEEEARDISSQTFLKAWDHIRNNSLTDHKTLKGLLYRVARNLIIDHYRKKTREEVSYSEEGSLIELADERQDLAKNLQIRSEFEDLEKKMRLLKDEYREALTLRYINELSVAEMAEILDKTRGNTRVLVYRALNALKEIMEPKEKAPEKIKESNERQPVDTTVK
jgi:RNA polymerase sigma-70 factor, ECF subfamily